MTSFWDRWPQSSLTVPELQSTAAALTQAGRKPDQVMAHLTMLDRITSLFKARDGIVVMTQEGRALIQGMVI